MDQSVNVYFPHYSSIQLWRPRREWTSQQEFSIFPLIAIHSTLETDYGMYPVKHITSLKDSAPSMVSLPRRGVIPPYRHITTHAPRALQMKHHYLYSQDALASEAE